MLTCNFLWKHSNCCYIFSFEFVFFLCQPTVTGEIQSPLGVATVEFIDPREPVAVSIWWPFNKLYLLRLPYVLSFA